MYWTASIESALQAADHVIASKPSVNLHNALLPKRKIQKRKRNTGLVPPLGDKVESYIDKRVI